MRTAGRAKETCRLTRATSTCCWARRKTDTSASRLARSSIAWRATARDACELRDLQSGYYSSGVPCCWICAENVRPGWHRRAPQKAKQICVLLHFTVLMETCSLGDNFNFFSKFGVPVHHLHFTHGSPTSGSLQRRAVDKVFDKRPLATIPIDMTEQVLRRTN